MTITLRDSSAIKPDVVLVHGAGRASASYAQGPLGRSDVFGSEQQVQTVGLVRAAAARVRPRGNRVAQFPFTAIREHATAAAARSWAAAHAASLDGYDRLAIEDGASSTLLHGALSSVRCEVAGVAVQIDYSFTYGATS